MAIDPHRAKEIFLEAIELTDDTARNAFLDQSCDGDVELRNRVEGLLRSHNPEGSFLGSPAAVIPDPDNANTMAFNENNNSESQTQPDEEILGLLNPPGRKDSLGRIAQYEVLQVLGKGGFGIVFRAFDTVLERIVAIKVMAPQLAATSPARKRFLREARSSAGVRHENVVQVYEVGEQPVPYLVMEFIPGETLQQRLDRSGPLDVTEVLRIGRQIAEGLAAAHATDLIHRDIKPGNILLESGPHGRAKITDFGLARAADDASISQSGIIAGTPMYMAPEQAQGQPLDHRADLFSLGSVLYQMASGRPPFRANSTLAVLKRVAEEQPRAIREIIPETPQWLCDIIAKLHAKNPEDRFQSGHELASVLADCEAQIRANSKVKDFSRIPTTPRKKTTRSRRWIPVAAGLFVVLAGLGLWFGPFAKRYAVNRTELTIHMNTTETWNVGLRADDGERVSYSLADSKTLNVHPGTFTLDGLDIGSRKIESMFISGAEPLGESYVRFAEGRWILHLARGESVTLAVKVSEPKTAPEIPAISLPDSSGFVQLFNGKDLTGWTEIQGKSDSSFAKMWDVVGDVLVMHGQPPGYIRTTREYRNFHLSLEMRPPASAGDLGMYCALLWEMDKDTIKPPAWPKSARLEFVRSKGDDQFITYGLHPSNGFPRTIRALDTSKNAPWHKVDVVSKNGELVIHVNGIPHTIPNYSPAQGFIGLHSLGGGAQFRNIRIREFQELPPNQSNPFQEQKVLAACKAAEIYLQQLDTGNFERVWDNVAAWAKQQGPKKDDVIRTYELLAKQSGKLRSRTPNKPQYLTSLPGTPEGEYVLFGYNSRYELWDHATEQLVLKLEADGQWRAVGYHRLQTNAPPTVSQDGFVQLFNGKDLTGWKSVVNDKSTWTWADGVLIGQGSNNYLVTDRDDYENFHLRASVRVKSGGASVRFRAGPTLLSDGYSAGIGFGGGSKGPPVFAGGLTAVLDKKPVTLANSANVGGEEWQTLEVIARGNSLETLVNGKSIAKVEDRNSSLRRGAIALTLQSLVGTEIHFKNVEIRELPAASTPVPPQSPPDFALDFATATSHVAFPSLKLSTSEPMTLEGYVTVRDNNFSLLFNLRTPNHVRITLGDNIGFWVGSTDSPVQRAQTVEGLPLNRRTHLACVFDGKKPSLFVDGIRQNAPITLVKFSDADEAEARLGSGRNRKKDSVFNGIVDEFRISTVARYKGNFIPERRFVPDKDTLALYHCDEGTGDILKDSSGNNHHGRIAGATWVKVE